MMSIRGKTYEEYLWDKYKANVKAIQDLKLDNATIVSDMCKSIAKRMGVEQVLMMNHGCNLSPSRCCFINPNSINPWRCVYCNYDISAEKFIDD